MSFAGHRKSLGKISKKIVNLEILYSFLIALCFIYTDLVKICNVLNILKLFIEKYFVYI